MLVYFLRFFAPQRTPKSVREEGFEPEKARKRENMYKYVNFVALLIFPQEYVKMYLCFYATLIYNFHNYKI